MTQIDEFSAQWGGVLNTVEQHTAIIEDHEKRMLVIERSQAIWGARMAIIMSIMFSGAAYKWGFPKLLKLLELLN